MRESRLATELKKAGVREALRGVLENLLTDRFGTLPADLLNRIRAEEDLDQLRKTVRRSLHVTHPEDVYTD